MKGKRPAFGRFHGFNAVAELKQQRIRALEVREPAGFHGFNAVAELKHFTMTLSTSTACKSFHGFNAVAELKQFNDKAIHVGLDPVSTASTPWPN